MECLHTYCKQCIYNYLKQKLTVNPPEPDCPRCMIKLETFDPFVKCVRFDRVMQNIVDKIFPHFEREDVERQISEQGDTKKQKTDTSVDVKKTFDAQNKITFEIIPHEQQESENVPDPSTDAKSNRFKSNIPSTLLSTITTKSEPASSFKPLPPMPKQFLRSSDQTVVKNLKIFVANKLGIDPNQVTLICLLYVCFSEVQALLFGIVQIECQLLFGATSGAKNWSLDVGAEMQNLLSNRAISDTTSAPCSHLRSGPCVKAACSPHCLATLHGEVWSPQGCQLYRFASIVFTVRKSLVRNASVVPSSAYRTYLSSSRVPCRGRRVKLSASQSPVTTSSCMAPALSSARVCSAL